MTEYTDTYDAPADADQTAALAAVTAALTDLNGGPQRVADALAALRQEVRDYEAAYAALDGLGLTHGHTRPSSLAGARALAALSRSKRSK